MYIVVNVLVPVLAGSELQLQAGRRQVCNDFFGEKKKVTRLQAEETIFCRPLATISRQMLAQVSLLRCLVVQQHSSTTQLLGLPGNWPPCHRRLGGACASAWEGYWLAFDRHVISTRWHLQHNTSSNLLLWPRWIGALRTGVSVTYCRK